MKKKQIAQLGITLGLVAAVGVGGTLALLQANTDPVTNTFTVGNGLKDKDLQLDETDVDNSTPDAERDKANTYENIEPQSELTKDPQVRVSNAADVADCYVFIKVDGCDAFLATVNAGLNTENGDELSDFKNWNKGWVKINTNGSLSDDTNDYDGLYVWGKVADGVLTATKITDGLTANVFDAITLSKDAALYTNGAGKTLNNITIDACAVQATSANSAYADAVGELPQAFIN